MKDKTILAMYSGGLDSLGMVYKLLTEPVYTKYNLHIHHVHIQNIENRHNAEAAAVNLALSELERLGFSFMYSESAIRIPTYNHKFAFDSDSINFFAGYICAVCPDIVITASGRQAAEISDNSDLRRNRAVKIFEAFTSLKRIHPVLHMTKREIYDSLPETLRDKFWSCRTPIYEDDKVRGCGACSACLDLKNAGIIE